MVNPLGIKIADDSAFSEIESGKPGSLLCDTQMLSFVFEDSFER